MAETPVSQGQLRWLKDQMNPEPLPIRALARLLDFAAAGLWRVSNAVGHLATCVEWVQRVINDAGFKLSDAGIWLLRRWERE